MSDEIYLICILSLISSIAIGVTLGNLLVLLNDYLRH